MLIIMKYFFTIKEMIVRKEKQLGRILHLEDSFPGLYDLRPEVGNYKRYFTQSKIQLQEDLKVLRKLTLMDPKKCKPKTKNGMEIVTEDDCEGCQ